MEAPRTRSTAQQLEDAGLKSQSQIGALSRCLDKVAGKIVKYGLPVPRLKVNEHPWVTLLGAMAYSHPMLGEILGEKGAPRDLIDRGVNYVDGWLEESSYMSPARIFHAALMMGFRGDEISLADNTNACKALEDLCDLSPSKLRSFPKITEF